MSGIRIGISCQLEVLPPPTAETTVQLQPPSDLKLLFSDISQWKLEIVPCSEEDAITTILRNQEKIREHSGHKYGTDPNAVARGLGPIDALTGRSPAPLPSSAMAASPGPGSTNPSDSETTSINGFSSSAHVAESLALLDYIELQVRSEAPMVVPSLPLLAVVPNVNIPICGDGLGNEKEQNNVVENASLQALSRTCLDFCNELLLPLDVAIQDFSALLEPLKSAPTKSDSDVSIHASLSELGTGKDRDTVAESNTTAAALESLRHVLERSAEVKRHRDASPAVVSAPPAPSSGLPMTNTGTTTTTASPSATTAEQVLDNLFATEDVDERMFQRLLIEATGQASSSSDPYGDNPESEPAATRPAAESPSTEAGGDSAIESHLSSSMNSNYHHVVGDRDAIEMLPASLDNLLRPSRGSSTATTTSSAAGGKAPSSQPVSWASTASLDLSEFEQLRFDISIYMMH
jgi:hypothetical protein